jgi:DNA-binding IclR family transcriptional regulator
MDEDKRSHILSEDLEKYTGNTLVDPTALKAELINISEAGYAVDREEVTRGIVCVAAPVFKSKAELLAAISVTFPAYVAEDRTLDPEIEHVTRCARRITEMLGGES